MKLWERVRRVLAESNGADPRPAPGKGAARTFAWDGTKAYYAVGNLTRWLIIGVMFVFLLTMAIVLTEVMAFQDRVVRLVGDQDRARDTVLMLHEIHNSPDVYREDQSLPFAALAVFLDRVRSAQGQLGRFRDIAGIEPLPDPNQSDGVQDPAFVRFAKERTRLTDSLNELNRVLSEQDPQFRIAQTLEAITRTVALLDQFTVAPEAAPQAVAALEEIKPAPEDVGAEVAVGQPEQAQDQPVQTPANTGHGFNGEAAAEMIGKVDDLRTRLTDLHAAAALDVRNTGLNAQLGVFEAAVEDLYALRLNGPSGLRMTSADDPPAARDATLEALRVALGNVGGAQNDLDRALTARFGTQYTVAKALANNINTMRDQAGAFAQLSAQTYTSSVGEVSEAKAAAEAYQKALAELNRGFADLERSLSSRTRIVAIGDVIRGRAGESEEQANAKARAILQDFDALGRFDGIMMPLSLVAPQGSTVARIGINPQKLATLSTVSITTIYIFMIGAIGSLIYITKYFIGQALRGRAITEHPDRPLSWLLFRPLFGVVVAFALYLVVQAGQLAFGTGDSDGFGTNLNVPIISVVALFAGLLSWQALAAIETRGKAWFGSQTRGPLWATGLNNALRNENKTVGTCAAQVGRSPEQVERWLMYVDQVTIEMQDRLITWLKRDVDELFDEEKPANQQGGEARWATGLREALESGERRLDAKGLAELLDEEDDRRVRKWLDLKLQVSPAMQWKLVNALKVPHHRLFDRHINNQPAWAVGLRQAMEQKRLTARLLDERIELDDVARIYAWKELDSAVPIDLQDDLVDALDISHEKLFHRGELGAEVLLWAHDLDVILTKEGHSETELATEVDVEPERVTAWIKRTKAVAPATRRRIAAYLNRKEEDIFKPWRAKLPPGGP